jgi:hypothetical protein
MTRLGDAHAARSPSQPPRWGRSQRRGWTNLTRGGDPVAGEALAGSCPHRREAGRSLGRNSRTPRLGERGGVRRAAHLREPRCQGRRTLVDDLSRGKDRVERQPLGPEPPERRFEHLLEPARLLGSLELEPREHTRWHGRRRFGFAAYLGRESLRIRRSTSSVGRATTTAPPRPRPRRCFEASPGSARTR